MDEQKFNELLAEIEGKATRMLSIIKAAKKRNDELVVDHPEEATIAEGESAINEDAARQEDAANLLRELVEGAKIAATSAIIG